jgi:hypothetical protein
MVSCQAPFPYDARQPAIGPLYTSVRTPRRVSLVGLTATERRRALASQDVPRAALHDIRRDSCPWVKGDGLLLPLLRAPPIDPAAEPLRDRCFATTRFRCTQDPIHWQRLWVRWSGRDRAIRAAVGWRRIQSRLPVLR